MEFNLATELGKELRDVDQAHNEHYPIINAWLKKNTNTNQIVTFNANEIEYIGYSYAKQTFRKVFSNLLAGEYSFYSLYFKYDKSDFEKVCDGLIYAFNQKEYSTFWLSESLERPKIIGYITTKEPEESKKTISKKKNLESVLNYILKSRELYTNDIAESLNLKLPNTNRILKELEYKRLIKRVKETSPSGGPIFLNKSIFSS